MLATVKISRMLVASVLCAATFGCAATGPRFTSAHPTGAEDALLYVYRSKRFCLAVRAPDIHLDGTEIGALSNNGYIHIKVTPGVHVVEAKGLGDLPATTTQFIAKPKNSYFLKWVPKCGFMSWKLQLLQVPHGVALEDIANSRAVE